jgi:glutathione S-transferase
MKGAGMIVLYELAGASGERFSPYCWRARMSLLHKGLSYRTVPTRYIDIASIGDGTYKTVPVIQDEGRFIGDSWTIANYLEDEYPDSPSLFGGPAGRALSLFVQSWVIDVLHRGMIEFVLLDIHDQLDARDKAYFRSTRERRFGRTLEAVQAGREDRIADFRKSLQPLRQVVASQPFLSGDAPLYPDYLAFSAFQWGRVVSRFPLLAADDPVVDWFERCLDLFGGYARRAILS